MAEKKVRMNDLPKSTEIRDEAIILVNQGGIDYQVSSGLILKKSNNLSEVDPDLSRLNLNVYSVEGINEKISESENKTQGEIKSSADGLLKSPSFSGNPTAPTAKADDRSITIANTDFVQSVADTMLKKGNYLSEISAAGADAVKSALSNLTIVIRNSMTFGFSTTWTCPAGVYSIFLDACAAGGGGGYSASGNTGGGGGGGGQSVMRKIIAVVPGTVYVVGIGAPGVGGSSSSVNGTQGGNTNFGNLINLTGGYGGLADASGGSTGGDGGLSANAGAKVGAVGFGGHGGGCLFGPGGPGGSGAMFGSIPGMFGGGGGGGAGGNGARGAYGYMKIWW